MGLKKWLKKKTRESYEHREAEKKHKKQVKKALIEARRKRELAQARKGIKPKGFLEKLGESLFSEPTKQKRRSKKKGRKRKKSKSMLDELEEELKKLV